MSKKEMPGEKDPGKDTETDATPASVAADEEEEDSEDLYNVGKAIVFDDTGTSSSDAANAEETVNRYSPEDAPDPALVGEPKTDGQTFDVQEAHDKAELSKLFSTADDDEIAASEAIWTSVCRAVTFDNTAGEKTASLANVRERLPDDPALALDDWLVRAEYSEAVEYDADEDTVTVLVDSADDVAPAAIVDADPDAGGLPATWEDKTTEERIEHAGEKWDWGRVRDLYADGQKGKARQMAAYLLLADHDWMYLGDLEQLWWYNPETGVYEREDPEDEDEEGDQLGEILEHELDRHWAPHETNHIKKRIKSVSTVKTARAELDAGYYDAKLVNVGNGVLNIETGDLHDHSPEYKFVTGLDTDWVKDAEPGRIDEFLEESTQREEDRLFLEEVIGHTLLPGYQPKLSLIMHGPPDTGKGVFEDVIVELLAGNTSHESLERLTSNRFATSSLIGSMANIGSDLSGNRINNLSQFKKLTGDDLVPVEKKGIDPKKYRNRATLIFSSNDPPTLGNKGEAVAERLYHVPFHNQHSNEDPDLPDKDRNLKSRLTTDEELERLLVLAVEGAQRLLENNDPSIPESKEERLEEYETISDPEARVANLITTEGCDSEDVILKEHAHKAYIAIADEMSTSKRLGQNDFSTDMTRNYLIGVETGQSRRKTPDSELNECWKGVRWTDKAARYLPDDVAERYGLDSGDSDAGGDDKEEDTTTSDEEGSDLVPVSELEPGDGYVNVAVLVAMAYEEPRPWLEGEGIIDAGDDYVDYHVRGRPVDLEDGETYILRDVKATSDPDGALVLEITPGVTEIEHVDPDTEQQPLDTDGDDDPDSGAGGDEEGDTTSDVEEDGSDTTSSDEEPGEVIIDRVEEEVRRRARNTASGQISRAAVSGRLCGPVSPDTVERAIDELVARGVVEATGGDALHVPGEGIEAGGDGE